MVDVPHRHSFRFSAFSTIFSNPDEIGAHCPPVKTNYTHIINTVATKDTRSPIFI